MLETAWHDLRYAARNLRQNPTFSLTAILVLGLGIGATTAIFSVLHAVMIQPLDLEEPERVARMEHPSLEWGRVPTTPAHFEAFREQAQSLDGLAAFRRRSASVVGPAGPEQLTGLTVLGPFFQVLGASPQQGRGLVEADQDPSAPAVIVLSPRARRRLLDAAEDPLGQTLRVDGVPRTIVGIAPEGLEFPQRDVDFWIPAQGWDMTAFHSILGLVVRLAPGTHFHQATQELTLISERLCAENPETRLAEVVLTPLLDSMLRTVRQPILLLMGAVVLVLLIACANVSNLLLARAMGRRREMAVRRALGAPRSRLLRQLLTESVLLGGLGAVVGIGSAFLGLRALLVIFGERLPRSGEISLDGTMLAFALGTSFLASLTFGVGPSWWLSRGENSWRGSVSDQGARHLQFQRTLAVLQTALAVTLLMGAGWLLRSLGTALDVEPGFETRDGLSFAVWPPKVMAEGPEEPLRFHDRLQERFESLPGVEAVARASFLPLNHRTGWASEITVRGREDIVGGIHLYRLVSPNYFPVLGSQRLEGRLFDESDRQTRRAVVVVNESLSRRLWPGGDALGATITLGDPKDPLIAEATVIGVVQDARDMDLVDPPRPVLYAPHHLMAWYPRFKYVVRTDLPTESLVRLLRKEVQRLDPDAPLFAVSTLEDLVHDNVADNRVSATLAGVFALLALLLATAGLFSLSSYLVARRSRELAVRMALGATASDVRGLVLRESSRQAVAGLFLGWLGALGLIRVLESLLYGVGPGDPVTYLGTAIVLGTAVMMATFPTARRAGKITPRELLLEN